MNKESRSKSNKERTAQAKARAVLLKSFAGVNPVCALCGNIIDLTLDSSSPWSFECDHILPISQGGSNSFDNLQPAHRKCNRIKQDRPIESIIYKGFSKEGTPVE